MNVFGYFCSESLEFITITKTVKGICLPLQLEYSILLKIQSLLDCSQFTQSTWTVICDCTKYTLFSHKKYVGFLTPITEFFLFLRFVGVLEVDLMLGDSLFVDRKSLPNSLTSISKTVCGQVQQLFLLHIVYFLMKISHPVHDDHSPLEQCAIKLGFPQLHHFIMPWVLDFRYFF